MPFCKSRCAYCDFFSTTLLEKRTDYVNALLNEINLRKSELRNQTISSIYFGGGTPSIIEPVDIAKILNHLNSLTSFTNDIEITIEANPGDINADILHAWSMMGINRLSIGVQSFNDQLLKLIGRRHNAEQARNAIMLAHEVGFNNISIDLIYGLPTQTLDEWKWELSQVIEPQQYAVTNTAPIYSIPSCLPITHISTYCLSYEDGTLMSKMLKDAEIQAIDDVVENEMYDYLVHTLQSKGFAQYEVSNFCKNNLYSHHNIAYWTNVPYCGFGAGAHSYDGINVRSWNVSNLNDYITNINSGILPFEHEDLSLDDLYNEKIMLRLRTTEGLNVFEVPENYRQHLLTQLKPYLAQDLLTFDNNIIKATLSGIHILNRIIEDLMI